MAILGFREVPSNEAPEGPQAGENAGGAISDTMTSELKHIAAPGHPLQSDCHDPQTEGARFQALIAATLEKDFYSAVCLVRRYFPQHVDRLSGELLFRFGVAFYQDADLDKARRCLELAAIRNGSWQPKAMLQVGCIHAAVGDHERAIHLFQAFLDQKPQKCFRRQALERRVKLQQEGARRPENAAKACQEGHLERTLVRNAAQPAQACKDRASTPEARRIAPSA